MALSTRSTLLITVGGLVATSVALFALIPGKPPVTVAFDRYEGDSLVLVFTNRTSDKVGCFWGARVWLKSSERSLSASVSHFNGFDKMEHRGSVELDPDGIMEVRLKYASSEPVQENSRIKVICFRRHNGVRRGIENRLRSIPGLGGLDLTRRSIVHIDIPPVTDCVRNAPDKQ